MNKKPNRRDLLRLIGASTATGSLQLYGTKTVQSVGGNITKRTIQIRNNLDKKQNFDISIVPASENGDDPIFEQTIRVPGNSKVTKNVNIQGGGLYRTLPNWIYRQRIGYLDCSKGTGKLFKIACEI